MKLTKEQIAGFSGSFVLCLLMILILSLVFLHTEIKAQEEGILVNFGTVSEAAGTEEPAASGGETAEPVELPVPAVTPQPETAPARPTPKPPIITQTTEQTAAIETAREKKQEKERQEAEKRRLAEEKRKREEEERQKREAINRQMSNAFGAGTTPNGSEGTAATGAGNQGSIQGNAATGPYTGTGGQGSFDLSGRSLRGGGLQRPLYDVQEEGSIAVEITVDPQGNVIKAEVHLRGTNIENSNMRKSAIEAAKKTKFNAISGTQNQIGTITYKYTLK